MAVPRLLSVIAVLSLLLAFIWGNAGSSCMEAIHQWHRAQQMKRASGISADTLIIPGAEYAALIVRDKREINYHGRMYDIVSVTTSGTDVVLSGHFDDFDDELFKLIDSFLGDAPDASKDIHRQAMLVFTGILPVAVSLHAVRLPYEPVSHIVHRSKTPLSPALDVLIPPPQARA